MRYPAITRTACMTLADQLAQGLEPSIDAEAAWVGTGNDVDLEQIPALARKMNELAKTWTDPDRDRLEGQMSGRLHEAMVNVSPEVLDDRGFWRYLALSYFWPFIAWREEQAFSRGNHLKYVDAISSTENVLTRMYLRAASVGGISHSDLAGAIPHSTDFWRSHVLRVRTGTAPAITRAFAQRQAELRLPTEALRATARSVNRTWTNLVLHLYDDQEAAQLIAELWPEGIDE